MATKFLDPDYRRDPKTNHFCCRCQRNLKPGQPYRMVHLVDRDAPHVLHPDNEATYVSDDRDLGSFPIGGDCARKIGLEWTHAA